jgi:hypothetical protein
MMPESTAAADSDISSDADNDAQPKVELSYSASDHVNVAFFQNAIPILRGISVTNNLGEDLSDVTLGFSSEPPFIAPGLVTISRIKSGSQHHLPAPDLKLDQAFLAGLTASRRSEITVRVRRGHEVLVEQSKEVNLLPPGFWGGVTSSPELLAAFVRPTDPSVDVILRDAAEKLRLAGKETAFDGYRSGKKGRAWEMAGAIWNAMVGYAITYVYPPASFEKSGQLVRGPSEVLERKVGTCLDLALTYASCIEQAVGERVAKAKTWPDSPRALAGRLRRAATFLRKIGIEIGFEREGRARTRTIRIVTSPAPDREEARPSASFAPSPKHNAANGFAPPDLRTVASDADGRGNGVAQIVRGNALTQNREDGADSADANHPL